MQQARSLPQEVRPQEETIVEPVTPVEVEQGEVDNLDGEFSRPDIENDETIPAHEVELARNEEAEVPVSEGESETVNETAENVDSETSELA